MIAQFAAEIIGRHLWKRIDSGVRTFYPIAPTFFTKKIESLKLKLSRPKRNISSEICRRNVTRKMKKYTSKWSRFSASNCPIASFIAGYAYVMLMSDCTPWDFVKLNVTQLLHQITSRPITCIWENRTWDIRRVHLWCLNLSNQIKNDLMN